MDISALVRRQVELCDQVADTWKVDHDEAMKCFDLQEWIAIMIATYEMIVRLDERWRRSVFRKEAAYDPQIHGDVSGLFEQWKATAERMEEIVRRFEANEYSVEHARDLRDRIREVRCILTPDADFFSHPSFVELRDKALDLHSQGSTLEHGAT